MASTKVKPERQPDFARCFNLLTNIFPRKISNTAANASFQSKSCPRMSQPILFMRLNFLFIAISWFHKFLLAVRWIILPVLSACGFMPGRSNTAIAL
jgi:hypothetical protein